MKVSINLSNHAWGGPAGTAAALTEVVQAADEAGLDTVWLPDHLLQADPTAGDDTEILEAYTTLGFLASASRRVRLGTMVSAVTFRPPALLLKAIGTLDVLSGGRAWLGLGAGYLESEATAMGLPLPPVGERFEHLEDTLQLAHHVWSGNTGRFEGARHVLAAPVGSPPPLTRPHPPILLGGSGEQRTLRLVARYADACNLFDLPDGGATIRRKLAVLDGHCADAGRRPETVERTVSTRPAPGQSGQDFAAHCEELAGLGIGHVVLHRGPVWTAAAVAAQAPLVQRLAAVP